ncbi:MAG TPA: ADP-forming succinate--CoA ligase subunit beta [Actinomycetota bacterium]|nr:ADP-forming succinate--CoA ligase subunit beta [Actinomycetota bacterium]
MDLFEHQGKELFAKHGIPVPDSEVAETPGQARDAAMRLGPVAVKAQVQMGGRGKGGGIVLARTHDEAESAARKMLEDGFRGMPVTRVLLESLVDIEHELYVAITLDRSERRYLAMTSSEGGIDIEEVAATKPQAIRRAGIDPLLGVKPYHLRWLTGGFPQSARDDAAALLGKLFELLVANDATLVEVNPLAVVRGRGLMPLDAKVTIDDNALYRHPDLAEYRAAFPLDPTEARAKEKGLQYVKLDGEIGIIGNGAGLVMATLDLVDQAGGRPANFLDIGGGAGADLMATSLQVILSDPAVRSVLVNIFGGITRCDEVAEGILGALRQVEATVPIVVRLDGTNAEKGRQILEQAGHERIVPAATMLEAAERAVKG